MIRYLLKVKYLIINLTTFQIIQVPKEKNKKLDKLSKLALGA